MSDESTILKDLAAALDEGECYIDEQTAELIAGDLRRAADRLGRSSFVFLILSSTLSVYGMVIGLPWPLAALAGPIVVKLVERVL